LAADVEPQSECAAIPPRDVGLTHSAVDLGRAQRARLASGVVTAGGKGAGRERGGWREELLRLDTAVYSAVAETPTPALDRAFRRLSRAADHSKLWLGSAAGLAVVGGARGRRAAGNGVASIALTSAVVNGLLKPLGGRRRPELAAHCVPAGRRVRMPLTRSFPSGHAASAFAFASGVAIAAPEVGTGLTALAALVAYSRVHTGVHYPVDVIAGSVTGAALAPIVVAALERRRPRPADN
jgi:membrane-associated phospholipid phosphatase